MAANFLATISVGGSLAELTASSRQRCTLIKMACAERVRGGQKRNDESEGDQRRDRRQESALADLLRGCLGRRRQDKVSLNLAARELDL